MHGEKQRHRNRGTTQAGRAELEPGRTGQGRRIQLGITGRFYDPRTIRHNATIRRHKQPQQHVALYFPLI